jgi:5-bromo-4-chloroindolyl phosphate hydrolysis protein
MVVCGAKRLKLVDSAKSIAQMARNNYGGRIPLETAARNLGKPPAVLYRDIGRMFASRYITGASIDAERREIVFDCASPPADEPEGDAILTEASNLNTAPAVIFIGIWLNAYAFLNLADIKNLVVSAVVSISAAVVTFRIVPKSKRLIETKKPREAPQFYHSGDEGFDEKMNSAADQLSELKRLTKRLSGSNIGTQLRTITETTQEILEHLKLHHDKIRNLRQFISYYLPSSIKLFNEYAQLTAQSVKTDNIVASIKSIEEFTERIGGLFQNELNNLYENNAVDITAEIAVMESMIQGGLKVGGIAVEETPSNPK